MNLFRKLCARWCGCKSDNQAVLKKMAEIRKLMATFAEQQAALVADLKVANAQLKKLTADTAGLQPAVDALKAKIVELEALVAAGGQIGQELIDLVAETKSLTNAVDENVPELPPV